MEVVRNVFDDATHALLDKTVLESENNEPSNFDSAVLLLLEIVSNSEGLLDSRYEKIREAKKIVREHPELIEKLTAAWNIQAFKDIRNLSRLPSF